MPTAYLEKVSKEQGIALKKLEEYWDKAKNIAKERGDLQGESYWKYVMGIFKNMAGMNGISVSAAYDLIESVTFSSESAVKKPAKHSAAKRPAAKKPVKKTTTKKTTAKKPARKTPIRPKKPLKPKQPVKAKRSVKKPLTAKTKRTVKKPLGTKLPEWWLKKSELSKKKYVEKHPGSKFVHAAVKKDPVLRKALKKAQEKAGLPVDDDLDDKKSKDEDDLSIPDEVHEKLNEEAPVAEPIDANEAEVSDPDEDGEKNDVTKAARTKKYKNIIHKAYSKSKEKIQHALKANRVGMKAVGHWMKGYELNEKEKTVAKAWGRNAGKLLLGALIGTAVGVAMFTPLAGMGPELGEHFMKLVMGESDIPIKEESDSADKSDDDFDVDSYMEKFQDWLSQQNIKKLAEQLKKEAV